MAVGAYPLFKLGFLVIKQISKPIANSIANRAKSSRIFRQYICIPTAQLFHWADVKIRMRILNLGKVSSVAKLDEAKAIETGSQLLSEFIILSIAASYIIFEYRRQSVNEEARLRDVEKEKADINGKVADLEAAVAEQTEQIRELQEMAQALHDKRGFFGKLTTSVIKSVDYDRTFIGGVLRIVDVFDPP